MHEIFALFGSKQWHGRAGTMDQRCLQELNNKITLTVEILCLATNIYVLNFFHKISFSIFRHF